MKLEHIPLFSGKESISRNREIDMFAREVHSWWNRPLFSLGTRMVKTWKALFSLALFSGSVFGLVWTVSFDAETETSADFGRPASLLEVMRIRGCVADGILSGYGGDTEASVDLINRSECLYLHRALESWLNPPDFELARRIRDSITKPNIIYGMFISEALNTQAEYYSSLEDRVLKFSDMCQPDSVGFWGDGTCKSSFASSDYRLYVRDITRKAMDMGVRSFLFGQIVFQDTDRENASGILRDMRQYAEKNRMRIAIGAQTGKITNAKYLNLFDYIEGGIGITEDGDIESGPCASRYEAQGWCWALLWHKNYAENANMILLHLDWSGIEGDDMSVFSAMSREKREELLKKLCEKFNKGDKKLGFLYPFLSTLYEKNGGCYGAKKSFYSPDNRYSCKDEDTMNTLLKKVPISTGDIQRAFDMDVQILRNESESLAENGKEEEKDDAEFDTQSVPSTMVAGRKYDVSVTMRNIGTTTWSDERGYRLGSQNPQDNSVWGGRIFLLQETLVSSRKKQTFGFIVTAPEKPGKYDFQWRMVREGQGWFGERSRNKVINVVPSDVTR